MDDWSHLVKVDKINKQFVQQKRKILLFVDNFSGHKVRPTGYSNIENHFFPPNMTPVVQPIDIHSFKCKYRQQFVREKLHANEYSNTMSTIDIVKAIYKLKITWDSVNKKTKINNFFRKAGFKIEAEVELVNKIVEVEDENYQEYIQVCYDLNSLEEFDYHAYQQIDNEL